MINCVKSTLSILLLMPVLGLSAPKIIINGLNDMNYGWTGFGNIDLTQNVCVGLKKGNKRYDITVDSNNLSNGFALVHQVSGYQLPFNLKFNKKKNKTAGKALTKGIVLTNLKTKLKAKKCKKGKVNSSLIVHLSELDLMNAPSGQYSSTLLLMVVPQ